MPIDNYINPASLAPPLGWTPSGAYAGFQEGNRQADYEKQMGLSQLFQKLALEKQTGENQDFQAARPSALEATIAGNQATAQTAVPKAQAALATTQENLRTQQLVNRLKEGTIDSDMITKLAENRARLGEIGQKQLDTSLNLAQSIAAIHETNPGSITPSTVKAMAASMGIDENSPIVQTLMADPGTSSKWASIIDKSNAAHRQRMEQIGLEKGADFDRAVTVAKIEAQARIDAAGITSGSTNFEAKAIIDAYTKDEMRKPENTNKTPEEIGGLVADRYSKSKWGLLGARLEAQPGAAGRALDAKTAETIASLEKTIGLMPEGDMRNRMQLQVNSLKSGLSQGGTATAAPSGIPKVTDAASYSQVPPGSDYLDPNGVKRTKPKGQ